MTKKTKKTKVKVPSDSLFIFKLLLYLILGSIWIKVTQNNTLQIPIPIGAIVAIFFSAHEHFKIDRKIEYVMILIAMFVGYFVPFGLYISH